MNGRGFFGDVVWGFAVSCGFAVAWGIVGAVLGFLGAHAPH